METFRLVAMIISLAAVLAYLNTRFLKLPSSIGLMVLSLGLSLIFLLLGYALPLTGLIKHIVIKLDFSTFLLDFMLGFVLFTGALHTDVARLRQFRGPIITFATIGTLLSTAIVGSAVYFLLSVLDHPLPLIYCLVFGALISPTDPIAVLAILRKGGIPESVETQITGESLFNDGIGLVVFLTLIRIASVGTSEISPQSVMILLAKEVGGGILLGLLLGYVAFNMLKYIDQYQTEVLITLAVAIGGITLASVLHFSGPLAMVAAGLYIGNKVGREAMSTRTRDYVYKFWEMIDEMINAILFVLIGLELLVIPFRITSLYTGLLIVPVILIARFLSLVLPAFSFRFKYKFPLKTFLLMTWGGLRGGISIALALSLSTEMYRPLFVAITYIIVLFSIVVQGLTLEKLVNKLR